LDTYDPASTPAAGAWLDLDESERLELVTAYHRRHGTHLPNPQLHALIHVVVENQIALGEQLVETTLARLEAEGLTRHDALHAIGSVLTEYLYELMRQDSPATDAAYADYLSRLESLSVASWRAT
jgi:hypothetical protein